jgi:hypothetical protein
VYENAGQKKLTAGTMLQLLLNYWQENWFLRIQEFCLWNIFILIVHNGVQGIYVLTSMC